MSNNGDDFEDDLDPAESEDLSAEDGSGDEDWDSYDDDQQDEEDSDGVAEGDAEDAPAPKKKSGLFNIILIAVAVIGVGGFLVMKMGQGGAPASAPAPAEMAVAPQPAPTPEAEPGGMLGSPDELAKLQEAMAKHAASAPVAAPAPAPIESVAVAPVPGVQVPATPAFVPQKVSAPKEVIDVKVPPVSATPVVENSVSKQADKSPVAVLDAAPVVVKTENNDAPHMPKAQDVMLKSPAAPEVTPAPAPTPSGGADAAALNVRIDTLMTRIASLESETSTLREKAGEADSLKATIAVLQKKLEESPASAPVKISKKTSAAKVETEVITKPAAPQILGENADAPARKTVINQPLHVSTLWVLKGAQPGQARVSKAGESDSQAVDVGDTLAGIGKITAIEYQGGRWSVLGTQGRINQ